MSKYPFAYDVAYDREDKIGWRMRKDTVAMETSIIVVDVNLSFFLSLSLSHPLSICLNSLPSSNAANRRSLCSSVGLNRLDSDSILKNPLLNS